MSRVLGMWCFALGAVVADRWLKSLALAGRTVEWPLGRFLLVKNEGAVFSWPVPNVAVIVIMVVAIVGLGWYGVRMWRQRNVQTLNGVLLMMIGAASNLYDRFAYGFVIDWAYLGPWWPVFNIADVMIAVGLVLLVLRYHAPPRVQQH